MQVLSSIDCCPSQSPAKDFSCSRPSSAGRLCDKIIGTLGEGDEEETYSISYRLRHPIEHPISASCLLPSWQYYIQVARRQIIQNNSSGAVPRELDLYFPDPSLEWRDCRSEWNVKIARNREGHNHKLSTRLYIVVVCMVSLSGHPFLPQPASIQQQKLRVIRTRYAAIRIKLCKLLIALWHLHIFLILFWWPAFQQTKSPLLCSINECFQVSLLFISLSPIELFLSLSLWYVSQWTWSDAIPDSECPNNKNISNAFARKTNTF